MCWSKSLIAWSPSGSRRTVPPAQNASPETTYVAPFAIAGSCVTEGEFAAFVDDGGYGRAELWTDEGWRWLASAGRVLPAHWRRLQLG